MSLLRRSSSLLVAVVVIAACGAVQVEGDAGDAGGAGGASGAGASGGSGGSTGGASGAGASGGTGGSTGGSGGSGIPDAGTEDAATDAPPILGEVCGNGIDDDGDGDIDCADSECAAWTCSLPTPIGFTGPAAFWVGPAGGEPECGAPFDLEIYTGREGPSCASATCPCSCDSPTGRTCGSVSVGLNNTANCPNGTVVQALPFNSCSALTITPTKVSMVIPSTPTGGNCAPIGGSPEKPAVEWTTTGRLCAGSGVLEAGCVAGTGCLPPLPVGFDKVCVFKAGDAPCPAAGYSEKHVLYGGVADTRGCTACSCSDPTGGGCSSVVTFYNNGICQSGVGWVDQGDTCKNMPSANRMRIFQTASPGGTCSASSSPTGGCTQQDPTTVCCIP